MRYGLNLPVRGTRFGWQDHRQVDHSCRGRRPRQEPRGGLLRFTYTEER
jgi:hypothetical protein